MSLTLPVRYSESTKNNDLVENWLVELSYYNGDSQGLGEGGYDAVIAPNGNANLINEALDDSETGVNVDNNTVFQVGDHIKIDTEIMRIEDVSGAAHTVTVTRGVMRTTIAEHDDDAPIFWYNFTPLALSDTTVNEVFYFGSIISTPTIRTSIDLARSQAKTSQVRLTLANFNYKGSDFSAELFGGTRQYLNRTVKIYSQLNNNTALTNCVQIYHGRLVDITHSNDQITLLITEKQPWDKVTIPQTKTSDTSEYFPISYGNFTANSTSIGYCASKSLYPIPLNEVRATEAFYLTGIHSITSTAYPHYYDRNLDRFLPVFVDDFSSFDAANESYKNGYAVRAYHAIPKMFKMKPVENVSTDSWTDGDHAFDTPLANDTSTKTSLVSTNSTPSSTLTKRYKANWQRADHKVASVTMTIAYDWIVTRQNVNEDASATMDCTIKNNTWGFNDTFDTTDNSSNNGDSGTTASSSTTTDTGSSMLSVFNSTGGWSDNIDIQAINFNSSGNVATSGVCIFTPRLYDVIANVLTEIDFTDKDQGFQSLKSINYLYCGGDGLTKSYNGGSGVATTGLEAHRDLLVRFTGYDDTDANIYNWNSGLDVEDKRIDTAAWNIRSWFLEPIELKKALDKIQYEFGFIFKFRADGVGSYWLIKDSYASGDVVQTLSKADINAVTISTTPFTELITKMEIGYEPNPATKNYISNITSEDSTNKIRAKLNIDTKENIKQVNLDMNVNKPGNADPGGGDANDGFADYYMNIYGNVKKEVSCNIINPAKGYNLETGDIIQFSNTAGEMTITPFGDNWADYYMVTELKRSIGKVSIKAREVG